MASRSRLIGSTPGRVDATSAPPWEAAASVGFGSEARTRQEPLLTALVAVTAFLYLLAALSRDDNVFLLAVLSTLIAGTSLVWSRFALAELRYSRQLGRSRLSFGDQTTLTIDLLNAKPLPLPSVFARDIYTRGLEVSGQEADDDQGRPRTLHNFLALRWYERVRRVYRVTGHRRGAYRFGPARVYVADLFGFLRRYRDYEGLDEVVVYPKVVPADVLGLPAGRPSGDHSALRRVIEDPLRFRGLRDYVPGDSVRHIHWKATARTGRLHTRVFDPSASHVLTILLDVQTEADPFSVVAGYLELAVSSAASLASEAVAQGYSVGLMSSGGSEGTGDPTSLPAGRREGHLEALLEALARLEPLRLVPFEQLVLSAEPLLPYGATVLAVTARPTEGLQEALARLQDAGHPVVLFTVGDELPDVRAALSWHHLGGREKWDELEALELA